DPFLAGNKLQVREKLLALGAPVAELYATYDVASQIDLAALPDEFVLKPHNLWSKTGVFVLQRLGGGVYWDAMSQSELTAQQIADAWERLSQEWSARGRAPVIMAEERIRGTYRP